MIGGSNPTVVFFASLFCDLSIFWVFASSAIWGEKRIKRGKERGKEGGKEWKREEKRGEKRGKERGKGGKERKRGEKGGKEGMSCVVHLPPLPLGFLRQRFQLAVVCCCAVVSP